ncbi:beta-1,3-galactosyltransferase 1-like isoform X1 [Centroberyx gerrardi]|uniref:beta-1,3-galactosyltransferase 1-like isoform X1 n=2 Tax=Centroberyx gerrardi TaxID=166262 RepID=UPI003AAAED9C
MPENGFANGGRSQEIMDSGKSAESGRCFSWPRRRCFLCILLVAAIWVFYNTNIMEMTADWKPKWWMQNNTAKWWMQNNTAKWWMQFKSATYMEIPPNTTDVNTNTSDSSPAVPQTEVVHLTENPPVPTAEAPLVTQLTTQNKAVLPTPIPYVSPGPYSVEYPYEYHFIINEPNKCEQQKPFVVLMVPVAPHNREHRDIIRSTWGSESTVLGKVVKLFFLLALHPGEGAEQIQQQLLQESREHQDLIQSDFLDCYKNLTIKTMVMLEWLDSHCSSASYAMKIDSDTFLNLNNLVNMLLNAPKDNYMTGLVATGAQVLRDPRSKWYLPVSVFPESHYPRYALGLGYVLSLDLPKKLVEASRHVKPVYIEDVYLGLCMRHLGISPTNPPNWNLFHVSPLFYNRCAYSNIIVTTANENTDRVWVWKDFKRPQPFC